MYLQITTKCQMSCEHCCFDCGPDGEHMSLGVFRAALKVCDNFGSSIFLGGGEPTLHPHFDTILLESIAATDISIPGEQIGIITNGGIKKKALLLANLTKREVIRGSLSQDQYHDPIDPEVVAAWKSIPTNKSSIRDTTSGGLRSPLPHGRARKLLEIEKINGILMRDNEPYIMGEEDCACAEWIVKPDGRIYQCGCEEAPQIGHVLDNNDWISSVYHGCHLSPEFELII